MAEVDVVKTVFQSEWTGGGVIANMIRQFQTAEKAIKSMQKQTITKQTLPGGNKGMFLDAHRTKMVSDLTNEMLKNGKSLDFVTQSGK